VFFAGFLRGVIKWLGFTVFRLFETARQERQTNASLTQRAKMFDTRHWFVAPAYPLTLIKYLQRIHRSGLKAETRSLLR
jgi:hypothetical protein